MLNTEIWQSKQVASLSRDARLLYIGLITLGDDDGRLKGDAVLLRSQVFPRDPDITVAEVEAWLKEIVDSGLVTIYLVDDEYYLAHPNWTKYQTLRADRKRDSKVPPPPDSILTTNAQPDVRQTSAQDKVSKDKKRKEKVDSLFEDFWKEYPNKTAKKKAKESWEKAFRDVAFVDAHFLVVMNGLKKAKASKKWVKNGGEFIEHPTTWLNQERWNDEGVAGGTGTKTHTV